VSSARILLYTAVMFTSVAWHSTGPDPDTLPPVYSPGPRAAVPSVDQALRDADSRLVAEVILGEDPAAGVAVAWTVRNRGRTVLETVTARRQYHGWRPRRWSRNLRLAQEEADAVLRGVVADPTRGATHFHRVGTPTPPWAPPPRAWRRFGRHWFYGIKKNPRK
jgi:hypothetical protein